MLRYPPGGRWRRFRIATITGIAIVAIVQGVTGTALAHSSSLGGSRESVTIPAWLVLMTGGAVIGASFLLVSVVTDRRFIDRIPQWGFRFEWSVPRGLRLVGGITAVSGFIALLAVGIFGPQTPTANLAVLGVWALWWAGYAMSVYLVGNSWTALNPLKWIARANPVSLNRNYPEGLGSWPAVVGLVALVWIEVTIPVAERPRLLVGVVLAYAITTLAGASLYDVEVWFERVDPVTRVFTFFGAIAPIQRVDDGFRLGIPGWRLVEDPIVEGPDDVTFVIGLLWLTTFDGFVATPTWVGIVEALVTLGVPPLLAYFGSLILGFAAFMGAFVGASRLAKRMTRTPLDGSTVAVTFAASLLPIAAGYHLAHYLGYFLHYVPSAGVLLFDPLTPPSQLPVIVIPDWFGTLQLAFVLVGHVVAIAVAHGLAFETFTGRLQPIRSQYAYGLVMVAYTMISIGIVYQPTVAPPYL